MAEVVLDNVSRQYRTGRQAVSAVKEVSLSVADGEMVAVVGPSGSGKTTLLRLIAGLERQDTGTIRIANRVVDRVAPQDRGVAMVFQNYALYPHMSVFKNIAFGLRMRKTPREDIRRRVAETVQVLGIADLLDRRPDQLSGGEQQRVALGRALVRRPQVLLLDEPFSNLDAPARLVMRAELRALQRRMGITTIHVTHDQEEALALGDRMVVLRDGSIQQTDAPAVVYSRPANRFVAEFIGTPPMNFVAGELGHDGDQVQFVAACGRLVWGGAPAPRSATTSHRVAAGFRPQHVVLGRAGAAQQGEPTCRHFTMAKVELVEVLGDLVNVHLRTTAGDRWIARAATDAAWAAGASADVWLDPARVHLFSADAVGSRLP